MQKQWTFEEQNVKIVYRSKWSQKYHDTYHYRFDIIHQDKKANIDITIANDYIMNSYGEMKHNNHKTLVLSIIDKDIHYTHRAYDIKIKNGLKFISQKIEIPYRKGNFSITNYKKQKYYINMRNHKQNINQYKNICIFFDDFLINDGQRFIQNIITYTEGL